MYVCIQEIDKIKHENAKLECRINNFDVEIRVLKSEAVRSAQAVFPGKSARPALNSERATSY